MASVNGSSERIPEDTVFVESVAAEIGLQIEANDDLSKSQNLLELKPYNSEMPGLKQPLMDVSS